MSEFTRPYAVPGEAQARAAQQAAAGPPDFLAFAADQLRRASAGATELAKATDGGEGSEKVIALRLQIAAGYTDLAAIQYSLPDEEGDPGDDEEHDGRR